MTDTEFTDLDLQKDISDMEGDEARETLVDFMEAHQTNRSAYDGLQAELDEVETEYEEKLEEREELIREFKEDRAEKASEFTNLPADLIVERFEYSEIEQIIEEGEEFSEAEDETEEEDEESTLLEFSEKPEKGRAESGGNKYRDRAADKLAGHGFPTSN